MTLQDIPAAARWIVLLPLYQRYGLTVEKANQQLEKAFHQGDILLTADYTETFRACAVAWMVPDGAFNRSPYLRQIAVREECAGKGIGSELLRQVEEASLRVSDALFLLVSDFNSRAQEFYQQHGYAHIGTIPDYVAAGVAELIFWKRLRALPGT